MGHIFLKKSPSGSDVDLSFSSASVSKPGSVLPQVVQLEELLMVRHSVFVVGNAGTGKSQVMKSLNKTYQLMKRRPVWTDLNPKAVTNDELFGIINPATREWKDGKWHFIKESVDKGCFHDLPEQQQDDWFFVCREGPGTHSFVRVCC